MKRLIATLAAATLGLAGCAGGGADKNGESTSPAAVQPTTASASASLTVGLTYVPDIQFAPFYVAEDQGYFREAGLDITLRHHGAQESLLGALSSGSEDVVFAGGDEMMEGRSNGINVVNWATMYQDYPVTLIVPADSPIKSAADLAGRRVGLPGPYGENYYALQALMAAHNWSESDISVNYIGYTQAAALASGEVDAIIGFRNSDVPSVERQGVPVRTIEMLPGGLPLVGVGLGSLRPTVDAHRDDFTRMLAALDRAVNFARSNPKETVKITAKHVPALRETDNAAAAEKVLANTIELYAGRTPLGVQDAQRWEAMAAFMSEKLLREPVAAADAFVDLTGGSAH
ncbi:MULTISPECIES: ABC transporter substrate-binding protein [Actinotignum]|uniref:ABC transporter substrate-binding protein n=1 Tax=Actinotignum TaxID=1653174 RepID=UPI000B354F6D|nr:MULTISPECIES: ABC transporter substrate-binding protein [Actinotignum]MDE1536489.1 ABC transporter substrate-binding protein [Actinotignum schaalii]MDK7270750.1 ABC transporter substrate-binding protein [Actinotignum schaalii]MDY5145160.1 ABC transporter substrate-binding protein [Actinotignum timonense]